MAIERIVPGTLEWDAFYSNHISRYRFAGTILQYAGARKILDAACGVGYGTNFLASLPEASVIGIDRSDEALKIAAGQFNSHPLRFLKDDCHTLEAAMAYAPYDAIVSFETVEHLPRPTDFLRSCHRALVEGGELIISTPNQLVSSPDGSLDWEFHEKEYNPSELLEMLHQAGFSGISLYGQRYTAIGKLRDQLRAELNILHANPFIRFGKWIQHTFRGHRAHAILPEQPVDFEIVHYPDIDTFYKEGLQGPFVLVAVCKK